MNILDGFSHRVRSEYVNIRHSKLREATVALELISRMKSVTLDESDDSFLSLYLSDTCFALISTQL